jgi:hypothetical protein
VAEDSVAANRVTGALQPEKEKLARLDRRKTRVAARLPKIDLVEIGLRR